MDYMLSPDQINLIRFLVYRENRNVFDIKSFVSLFNLHKQFGKNDLPIREVLDIYCNYVQMVYSLECKEKAEAEIHLLQRLFYEDLPAHVDNSALVLNNSPSQDQTGINQNPFQATLDSLNNLSLSPSNPSQAPVVASPFQNAVTSPFPGSVASPFQIPAPSAFPSQTSNQRPQFSSPFSGIQHDVTAIAACFSSQSSPTFQHFSSSFPSREATSSGFQTPHSFKMGFTISFGSGRSS